MQLFKILVSVLVNNGSEPNHFKLQQMGDNELHFDNVSFKSNCHFLERLLVAATPFHRPKVLGKQVMFPRFQSGQENEEQNKIH